MPGYTIDWDTLDDSALAPEEYVTELTYDALNRVTSMTCPNTIEGAQPAVIRPSYNRAGALERVEVERDAPQTGKRETQVYVEHIAYNAKGQRTLLAYGDHVMTRYRYDDKTFRLERLRSERYEEDDLGPDGKVARRAFRPVDPLQGYQDFGYGYDLVGNIIAIHDRTPGCGTASRAWRLSEGADRLDRDFTYDAVYRLLSATGRQTDYPTSQPWDPSPRSDDPSKAVPYRQKYAYDAVGNLVQLAHRSGNKLQDAFTRHLPVVPALDGTPRNNQLRHLRIGEADDPQAPTWTYDYDVSGNMTREGTNRRFFWDHADRMKGFQDRPDGAAATVEALYLYDAGGERVKKLVREAGGGMSVTVCVDGVFEERRDVAPGGAEERADVVHVMDGEKRVGELRYGAPLGDATPAEKIVLADHLGSANVTLGWVGDTLGFVNREEYLPYGETGFGGYGKKRYRYTGKERDAETGWTRMGARYYACYSGRWVSADPAGMVDGVNLFRYCRGSPLLLRDPEGTDPKGDRKADANQTIGRAPTIREARASGIPLPVGPDVNQVDSNLFSSMPEEERRAWYEKSLGAYQEQIYESAAQHHLPPQLLAAVILAEMSDYGDTFVQGYDGYQDKLARHGLATSGGSLGYAQIQPREVVSMHLLDATDTTTAGRLLQVPQYAIEAMAGKLERFFADTINQDALACAGDPAPWVQRHFARLPQESSADATAIYDLVYGTGTEQREGELAHFAGGLENSPELGSARQLSEVHANAAGQDQARRAEFVARELFRFGMFRPR